MPIKILGKVYKTFGAAVKAVMREKGLSREAAERYVGKVEHQEKGGK